MKPVEALGVLTALCIAFSSLAATPATRHLGAIAFTRWRMIFTFLGLALATSLTGGWSAVPLGDLGLLAASALLGVVVGDTALYGAMANLGPRRTSLLYALSSPFSALLAFAVLGERLSLRTLAGLGLILAGIAMAIFFRAPGKPPRPDARPGPTPDTDPLHGHLWSGIGLGVLAAAGQGAGLLFTKAAMRAGHVAPLTGTTLRVGFAALGLIALAALPGTGLRARRPLTRRVMAQAAASGLLGMGVGATLQMLALAHGGRLGVVATLSAMTPVVILPLLWITSRQVPATPAWIGAVAAVAGAALILVPHEVLGR